MPAEIRTPEESQLLDLAPSDIVYWLTNGVGEIPEIHHEPRNKDTGEGGDATLWVGCCPMIHVPYSDDIEDAGVLGIAQAVANAGRLILWYRGQMQRIQYTVGRALAGDRERKILLATLDRIIDLSVEEPTIPSPTREDHS